MTPPQIVAASRRPEGDGTHVIGTPPELRRIVLAEGIQFNHRNNLDFIETVKHRTDVPEDRRDRAIESLRTTLFPEEVVRRVPGVKAWEADGHWHVLYFSAIQNVTYVVDVITTKSAFRAALMAKGTIVIYDGHARYGRGPCFGPSPAPGDDWERGSDPADTGLFRMGYPFNGISVHEILEHGYHTRALPSSEARPASDDCDPDTRKHLGDLQARRVAEMHGDADAVTRLAAFLGVTPGGTDTFWTYRAVPPGASDVEVHVVLRAGWKETSTAPYDLGATDLACRMFCHFGCSSFPHNHGVVRKLAGWRHQGDDRYAYWTTDASVGITTPIWLTHMFTYPQLSGGESWDGWLRYTLRRTNADLRDRGAQFRII